MAYVEVRRNGRVVTRRGVDEKRARRGCVVRVGAHLKARVKAGQTVRLGDYEVHLTPGVPPAAILPKRRQDSARVNLGAAAVDDAFLPDTHVPAIDGYRMIRPLGEGGFGSVWLAVQEATGRQVAVKFLSARMFASAKARLRFQREVRLCARLNHPNVARIYDSGLDHNVHFYAMEVIDGVPLSQFVREARLDTRGIANLMRGVCEAVAHAHANGVIHRDLKPANILVTSDGQPHVLDFGLAKAVVDEDSRLAVSVDGEATGTPAYMSPEQAAGYSDRLDPRTDVYSLGVILFRLVTGESPHELSGTQFEIMRRIVELPARRARTVSRAVDRELEAILLRALAHEPDDRYPTAAELAQDLDNYLNGKPVTARAATVTYLLRKRLARHRRPAVVFLASSALTLTVTLLVTNLGRRDAGPAARTPVADAAALLPPTADESAAPNDAPASDEPHSLRPPRPGKPPLPPGLDPPLTPEKLRDAMIERILAGIELTGEQKQQVDAACRNAMGDLRAAPDRREKIAVFRKLLDHVRVNILRADQRTGTLRPKAPRPVRPHTGARGDAAAPSSDVP